jgi:hypothetical protein
MHPTRDTNTFINLGRAGGRVMRALDCWGNLKTSFG